MSNQGLGHATGGVRALLQIEGAALLLAALFLYEYLGGDWVWFAILFLVPDLSMLGYLAGARFGAVAYNAAHSTLGPLAMSVALAMTGRLDLMPYAVIWFGHIGFDRMLGYGLKYSSAFGDTHLLRLGRQSN
jgi:hypothetical protein